MTVYDWENPFRGVDPDVDLKINGHLRKVEGHYETVIWLTEDKTFEEVSPLYGDTYKKFPIVDSSGLYREPIGISFSIFSWS